MTYRSSDDIIIKGNVSLLPEVKRGATTTINYDSLLNNSGADKVYLHYGFDGWKNTETVPMTKSFTGGYNTEIKVFGKSELNFCFKDSANNWDNNNGNNWTTEIEQF